MNALISPTTTVSTNMQTYVPKKVQEVLDLEPSESLEWIIDQDENITIKKIPTTKEVIAYTKGAAKKKYSKEEIDKRILNDREEGWDENE
ncbi:hypothetical protein GF389_01130 [Candidatus Dojkabacteria bacterium]|nr:hypothetical protein [Candidatus Dojkabacteria bacterium]